MNPQTIHFVEYLYPGILMAESSAIEVKSRDWKKLTNVPKGCFAFRFFDVTRTKTDDGEVLQGEQKNYSGTYYPEPAKIFTKKDVLKMDNPGALVHYTDNGGKVIQTRLKNFQQFLKGDQIVKV